MDQTILQGRYHLEAEIGRGGMGVIYRARDLLLDRVVAVKVMSQSGVGTPGRARLLNEARAAARLNHPNIVTVYDAGEVNGTSFVVMEYVEGESLHEQPPQDLDAIVSVVQQVCAALDHAHTHGIIHRDLKPENVLITPEGVAKLTDFGLARSVASRLTSEAGIVGTVLYLAPELALGQPFDGRADLYALGVMLYELTTRRLPFIADDPLAVISQHLYAPVVPPRAYNPDLPPALEALIVELLSKRPEERPASAAEVRRRLEHLDEAPAAAAVEHPSLLDRIARGRFVGRLRELAEAEAQWRHVQEGEGRVLLVSGEPGVGKTRFVRELLTQVRVSGGRVLTGECYADASTPYAPIAQIIREGLEESNLDHLLPTPVLADLMTLAPELRTRYPDVPLNPPLDPALEQQRVFESVVTWCSWLAGSAPLVLFLDDVHWADSASLALLRHLARRTRKQRVLIIATYREIELDERRPWSQVLVDLNRERLATRVKLTRLNLAETRDLLHAMFQQDVAQNFLSGVYHETEGNPFFVEEVCKALVEEGQVYYEGGRWCCPTLDESRIPQSVRLAIQARVGKLSDEAQETLRVAAILGREFDYGALKHAGDLDEDALITSLEAAQRAQLIDEVRGREEQEVSFAFAHALIRLTLLESIGGLRRSRLHRRAAVALETVHPDDYERIAQHYQEAGEAAQARGYYKKAGERALAVLAFEEAEQNLNLALELRPSDAERVELLEGLGKGLAPRGRFEQALDAWREAIELARKLGDNNRVAELYTLSARAAWVEGNMPRALELTREGLAAVADREETPALAALLHETARQYYFNGIGGEAGPLCDRALEMARRFAIPEVEAEALTTKALLLTLDHQYEECLAAYRQAIALAEEWDLYLTGARAHHNLGSLLLGLGRINDARAQGHAAVELSRKAGDKGREVFSLTTLIFYSLNAGELAEADSGLERARQLLSEMPESAQAATQLAPAEATRNRYCGQTEEAIGRYLQVRARVEALGDVQGIHGEDMLLGDTMYELGRYEEAERYYREAVELGDQLGLHVEERALLSRTYSALGRVAEARRMLEEARSHASPDLTFMQTLYLTLAEARLAVAEQDWEHAFGRYDSLVARQEKAGLRWGARRALRENAEARLARGAAGDRERACALLQACIALARETGAEAYARQVEARLAALEQQSDR